MATILYFKRIVLSSQQHAYPASRQISALRVSFLFGTDIHIYTGKAGVGKSPNQSFLFI